MNTSSYIAELIAGIRSRLLVVIIGNKYPMTVPAKVVGRYTIDISIEVNTDELTMYVSRPDKPNDEIHEFGLPMSMRDINMFYRVLLPGYVEEVLGDIILH